jgi:hypothetical protein
MAIALIAIAGCGPQSDVVALSGSVSTQSRPVVNGTVQFFPSQGRPAVATIDDLGRFSIELAPGDYQVTVNASAKLPPGWKEGDPVPQQEMVIPAQYTTRVRTPLKVTVAAGQNDPIDFVLP